MPREAWESLFALRDDAARDVRTVEALADLDVLRRQAKEPGSDDEFLVLHLPLETDDQDRYTPAVLAHFKGDTPSDAPPLTMGHLLIRRGDLRELAIDTGWMRAADLFEALNDRMADESKADALAQMLAQEKVIEDLERALARFEAVAP